MLIIRNYVPSDWDAIESIHDGARKIELELAGLKEAFLPLKIAAEREDLFAYPGLFVAQQDENVVGFSACTQEELAWLYVDPAHMREGIGRRLVQHALEAFPQIHDIEVLKGNEPAYALYKSFGFQTDGVEKGLMPGNEDFTVEVFKLSRHI